MTKKLIFVFVSAFFLNLGWEFWHSRFYIHYQSGEITNFILTRAALFDALVITILALPVLFLPFFKKRLWLGALAAVFFAMGLELFALKTGRWAYNDLMPVIPIINTGLTPTFQLGIISWTIFATIKHMEDKKKNGHGKAEPPFEYNQITEQIFLGTNSCCKTHFEEELLAKGVSVDMSLDDERVDMPYGVEYYVWIPLKNYHAPTHEQVDVFVANLDKFLALGKKIYLHCKNGHGRAPTMLAAYFIKKGDSPDEAIEKIKEKRPTIHLDDKQMDFLKNRL